MESILVTGGAGFIGSHLCERLLREGHQVVALDNFDEYYDRAVKERNLREVQATGPLSFVEGDIRDSDLVSQLLRDRQVTRVVHLAALAGVRRSLQRPDLYADVNVRGLSLLLECLRHSNVAGLVFASSSSVYGNTPQVPWQEDEPCLEPISPYAATKRAGELLCYTHHHLYGLPISCLRFFTVYGPRQRPDMGIHQFIRRVLTGQTLTLFGDGTMERDYTYIDDIINGVTAATHRCADLGFQVFNLGNTHRVALRDLVSTIEAESGARAIIEWKPEQPGDVKRTWADVSRAAAQLGYQPKVGIAEGVRRFVRWMREVELGQTPGARAT